MSDSDLIPEEALGILLRKVRERDVTIADRMQEAINTGRDIKEIDPAKGRRKSRTYRRKVAYTHKDALQVAINVLQAHFVELPLLINSAKANFEKAAIGIPVRAYHGQQKVTDEGVPKSLQIEIQTETQLSPTTIDILELAILPQSQIDEQRAHLSRLRKLLEF